MRFFAGAPTIFAGALPPWAPPWRRGRPTDGDRPLISWIRGLSKSKSRSRSIPSPFFLHRTVLLLSALACQLPRPHWPQRGKLFWLRHCMPVLFSCVSTVDGTSRVSEDQFSLRLLLSAVALISAEHMATKFLLPWPHNRTRHLLLTRSICTVSYTHLTLPTKRIV